LTAIVSEIHGFVLLGCVTKAVFIVFVLAEMAAKMTIWKIFDKDFMRFVTHKRSLTGAGQQILGPQRVFASSGGRFFGAKRKIGRSKNAVLVVKNNVSNMEVFSGSF